MRKKPKQRNTNVFKRMHEEDIEDLRESISLEKDAIQPDTMTNWSEAQDRSEDLINETDPFVQDPRKKPRFPKDNRL